MTDRIDEQFSVAVAALAERPRRDPALPVRDGATLTGARCLELFDAQLGSRHLDLAARELGARGAGYYTIGSSGHEGNVAVAAALRPTDPALLHYRSGGFYLERARQVPGSTPLSDVLLGVAAAATEPIAGGRHKVFGNKALAIIPQTSTIASHLPRAVGVAFGIERAARLGVANPWPAGSIVVCSFGDASVNHSTALGAFNAARHCAYQNLPLPVLFVCEDNGIGISVRTPPGWVHSVYSGQSNPRYFTADGSDLLDAVPVAAKAAAWVRDNRMPAFLHLRMVRLMGHAGSDVESAYREPAEIEAELARDPVLRTATMLVEHGILTPAEVLARYEEKRAEVGETARRAETAPRLGGAAEVMAPLRLRQPAPVTVPATTDRLTLAQGINQALSDLLAEHREVLVFGEDVARKGGVYGVTRGLLKKFGPARVFDTLLDEQSILGLALGTGLCGFLPVAEIQYLAYLHNAADQLRGEAATLRFFSTGQYHNPMIVRIAGYGYQKGFGGHFHNDNAVAALRDIPGLVIASPARADDAAAMLRTCAAASAMDGRVSVFLEPIALYHTRDLFIEGDGAWLAPAGSGHVPLGSARVYGDGNDLTLVTFGNGVRMSLRVARQLAGRGIHARVVDLRWLAPLPVADILRHANATGRVLIVDETRRTGGVSESVITALVDAAFPGRIGRVTSEDTFVPLGPAAHHVLVSEPAILTAATTLCR
ncbi:MAG TPA: thiamine pyrophosphate-dependent enzyme [Actinophytocola sp.]|uniref:thiamine pyrophosphate-dependent enzyme n=1 Tax=Actinophytocola sp. TaxID=1872138 RepID=UPI002DBCB745|nr:thiamine pyrophosphate-dependent enzyme [Actinophytocola sp.]HEU5475073.1 thiamine pyrophosphate-dependent enzyme [Actinophytocola sp.]